MDVGWAKQSGATQRIVVVNATARDSRPEVELIADR